MSSSLLPPMAAVLCLFLVFLNGAFAQLSSTFYDTTCPNLTAIVAVVVRRSMLTDVRAGAKLIRLHYLDCFVNGCDASILLDNADGILSERDAVQNAGITGMNIVDDIKTVVEDACLGIVSCADILALSSEIAIVLAGGQSYEVQFGRRDSTTANREGAAGIPSPTDTPSRVISLFNDVGLDTADLVALSGAHTFGRARCHFFQGRLYNFSGTGAADPSIDLIYLAMLRAACPKGGNLDNFVNLDATTPDVFDNNYYANLVHRHGLLQTDQDLFTESATSGLVTTFANSHSEFSDSFGAAMIKMGNIDPLTGDSGQIRANCHFVNA